MSPKQTVSRPSAPRSSVPTPQAPRQSALPRTTADAAPGKSAARPKRATSSAKPTRGRSTNGTSIPRADARRPQRSSNQNTVDTQPRPRSGFSLGGLTISARALVLFLVAGLIALVLIPSMLQWSEQRREYRAIQTQVAASQQKIDQLQQDLNSWSDPEYVASQARSRLGYVKQGETQFSVADAPALEDPAAAAAEPVKQGPEKPWTMNLEKALVDLDNPPAVKQAANE